jgi:hypothetical protein
MKSLIELLNHLGLASTQTRLGTDKSDPHTYLQNFYEELFNRMHPINSILEIGIWKGASLALWKHRFPKATVVGVDIKVEDLHPVTQELVQSNQVEVTEVDAYSREFFENELRKFDIIIDDGPHTLTSQILALEFREKLSDQGVLVIEDVQKSILDFVRLKRSLPKNERVNCLWISFSDKSYRYDDAVFIYSRSKDILDRLRKHAHEFQYWGMLHPLFYYPYRAWTRLIVKLGIKAYK